MEKHEIVEILNSRKKEDVVERLQQYTDLERVSRDGSLTYTNAITETGGDIHQINDRFHLLKNLSDYSSEYIKRQLPTTVQIPTDQKQKKRHNSPAGEKRHRPISFSEKVEKAVEMRDNGISKTKIRNQLKMDHRTLTKYLAMTKTERETYLKSQKKARHDQTVQAKQQTIEKVREMHRNGFSQRAIKQRLGIGRGTVIRYLDPTTSAVHGNYGKKKRSVLDPYRETIIEQFEKGQPGTVITKMIRQKGYNGSDSLVRHLIASLRKQKREDYFNNKSDGANTEPIKRKNIIKMLYKPFNEIKGFTKEQFEKLSEKYPKVARLLNLVHDFKTILKTKAVAQLEHWMNKAKQLKIKRLNSFLSGLNRHIESVKNAIRYRDSNGLAEGKVNKIKNIKKIMYGRCSFELLQAKVMLLK